ncbi:MAG TPA: ribokinase [Ktedonobacteraceae bacterium]|nr:ribokinase [Ktedonobacteraceae bacterium]
MGRVIVLGSTITDLVARAHRLPLPGEALVGDDFATYLGGKGFNQAVAAARMGADVTFIGRVGVDAFGDAFAAALEQEGIERTHLTRDNATGTGTACVMIGTDRGQNAIIVLPQANFTLSAGMVEEVMQSMLKDVADQHTIFIAQCEMRLATITAGLRCARNAGMTTVLNAAPAPRESFSSELFALIDMLVVNESEAGTLANLTVNTPDSAMEATSRLIVRGPSHVIVTLGEQGSIWSSKTGEQELNHRWVPAIPVTQVDATAAGDAFCGALAAQLAQGLTTEEALHRANVAGALAVTRQGAFPSLPTQKEVQAFLASGSL